ncbi:hypothetical protein JIN84_11300 [Luteolibacter yonseiensis]|uniref:Uncharacterized protein n=1 Tax=Luteolibacter yonseiensis TaxID=1144680 RepID=A0A934R6U8_9BACT|nr:hypothetical protein [Luteolibacter yonseiensis]MBK1816199.1 hypothetical protein [Luteolibacter yonseiensis]
MKLLFLVLAVSAITDVPIRATEYSRADPFEGRFEISPAGTPYVSGCGWSYKDDTGTVAAGILLPGTVSNACDRGIIIRTGAAVFHLVWFGQPGRAFPSAPEDHAVASTRTLEKHTQSELSLLPVFPRMR